MRIPRNRGTHGTTDHGATGSAGPAPRDVAYGRRRGPRARDAVREIAPGDEHRCVRALQHAARHQLRRRRGGRSPLLSPRMEAGRRADSVHRCSGCALLAYGVVAAAQSARSYRPRGRAADTLARNTQSAPGKLRRQRASRRQRRMGRRSHSARPARPAIGAAHGRSS